MCLKVELKDSSSGATLSMIEMDSADVSWTLLKNDYGQSSKEGEGLSFDQS